MIKLIASILLLCIFIYVLFSSFAIDEKSFIQMDTGKIFTTDDIKLESGKFNYKQFSHSFWLWVGAPPNYSAADEPINYSRVLVQESEDSDSDDLTLNIQIEENAVFKVQLGRSTSDSAFELNYNNFPLQSWTHVALVLDNNIADLYINGSLSITKEFSSDFTFSSYNATRYVVVGDSTTWTANQGIMAFYKYYSRPLSQNDVKSIYSSEHSTITEYSNDSYKLNLHYSINGENSGKVSLV